MKLVHQIDGMIEKWNGVACELSQSIKRHRASFDSISQPAVQFIIFICLKLYTGRAERVSIDLSQNRHAMVLCMTIV
jgi:hypothetical protein